MSLARIDQERSRQRGGRARHVRLQHGDRRGRNAIRPEGHVVRWTGYDGPPYAVAALDRQRRGIESITSRIAKHLCVPRLPRDWLGRRGRHRSGRSRTRVRYSGACACMSAVGPRLGNNNALCIARAARPGARVVGPAATGVSARRRPFGPGRGTNSSIRRGAGWACIQCADIVMRGLHYFVLWAQGTVGWAR